MGGPWKGFVAQEATVPSEHRVHMDDAQASRCIAAALHEQCLPLVHSVDNLLVLCIGTDRSIGDALGPLVGSELERCSPLVNVWGTLENPVHASNLRDTIEVLHRAHPRSLIIAVDACLGRLESVGVVTIGKGSLRPGAGVNKSLPAVGDLYITGVVNVGGFMEYFVLQNTRLSLVMRMAQVVSKGIYEGVMSLKGNGGSNRT